MASSAIGAQIAQLEEDVGTPLFDRMPRGMRLNSAGETFLHHGRRAALELERGRAFVEQLNGSDSGFTSLATVEGLAQGLVASAFSELWKSRPNIRLSLHTTTSGGALEMVEDGQVELGLSYLRGANAYVRVLAHVKLDIGILLPANHVLAGRPFVSLQELAETGTPLLLSDTSINVREILESAVGRLALARQSRITSNSTSTLTRLAQLGGGAAVRTRLGPSGQSNDTGLAFSRLRELKDSVQELALFTHAEARPSPAGQYLIDRLTKSLEQLPD